MAVQPLLIDGQWRAAIDLVDAFRAENPATGEAIGPSYPVCGAADVEAALSAASRAAPLLAATPPERIAAFLNAYAAGIEADAELLVELAHAETALPKQPRLAQVELPRTTYQLRQAAKAVRDRSWTQPVIDTASQLRTHRAPLSKPVVVFGPNNFPLAFNAVAGSDFASAIAARNPVIAKAHPSHPGTSERLARIAVAAARDAGLPSATIQMLYHLDAQLGTQLVGDARVGAMGFTGSRAGGLALKAAADASGIPAYVELSSVNPVFLLPGALAERGAALPQEFFASCTMGSGQFCTNPGIVIVPMGEAGDAFVAAAREHFAAAAPLVLFSRGVLEHLQRNVTILRAAGAQLLAGGDAGAPGYRHAPTLLSVDADAFLRERVALQTEAFGPVSLLVRTRDAAHMQAVANAFEGNLTGTIYSDTHAGDDAAWHAVAQALRPRVGRLIGNRMPTGVAVSAAMNHGGPYPSTGHPGFTAVGMPAAISRFTALHCYDHVPEHQLPPELRDANPGGVARCIDGVWCMDDLPHGASHA